MNKTNNPQFIEMKVRSRSIVKLLHLFVFQLFLLNGALAQRSQSELEDLLAAEYYKDWIQEEVVSIMHGDSCKAGVIWKFFKPENKVEKKTCIKGRWSTTNMKWTLKKEDEFSWYLQLGKATYSVSIGELEEFDKLILRTTNGGVEEEIPLFHMKE